MRNQNFLKVIFIFFTVLLFYSPLRSQDFNKGGRTSFQFVKIGIGARQAGLGEACVAYVKDVNSVFWNPAGITGVKSLSLSVSQTMWFADMNYNAGVAGITWDKIGTFALTATSLDYGDIPEAFVTGQQGTHDSRTGETFTGSDMMLGLTYARNFTDKLSLGISGKYLKEQLFKYKSEVYAFDIGSYYDTGFKGITIGMSAQNFTFNSVRFLSEKESDRGDEGYDIPFLFKVGTSLALVDHESGFLDLGKNSHFSIAFDAVNTNDFGERYYFGSEYWFRDLVALRGGYRFNHADGNLALGFGINSTIAGSLVQVDYAYTGYKYLSIPHRFTVSFGF